MRDHTSPHSAFYLFPPFWNQPTFRISPTPSPLHYSFAGLLLPGANDLKSVPESSGYFCVATTW
jgi:hypothetical protein